VVHEPNPKEDTSLSSLVRIVGAMTQTSTIADSNKIAHEFFERYAAALLARDEKEIARMYAVPSLILFPGQSIVVNDSRQTEQFFAAAWDQYEGVEAVDKQIVIMGEAAHSIWADVSWSFGGRVRERFCYQLVRAADGYRIAVLTPIQLP
jgi:hypothetical protein